MKMYVYIYITFFALKKKINRGYRKKVKEKKILKKGKKRKKLFENPTLYTTGPIAAQQFIFLLLVKHKNESQRRYSSQKFSLLKGYVSSFDLFLWLL